MTMPKLWLKFFINKFMTVVLCIVGSTILFLIFLTIETKKR